MRYLLQLYYLMVVLHFIQQSSCQVFYITPDPVHNVSCSEANTTLTPCYTLDELNDTVCHRHSVLLFFLSGKHVASQPFHANNTQNLVLSSWNEQHGVVIECMQLTGPNFNLADIAFIDITAIKFSHCSMKVWNQGMIDELKPGTDYNVTGTLEVINSMFVLETKFYVLDIGNLASISIVNSTFVSNYGAISTTSLANAELFMFNLTFFGNIGKQINASIVTNERIEPGWWRRKITNRKYVYAFIEIEQINHVVIQNCIFNSNHGSVVFTAFNTIARVVIIRSSFRNNEENPAIYINNTNLSLNQTLLINNTDSAIYAETSHIYINVTSIKYNKGYRGALALYSCSLSIYNSSFVGNKADESGGAIYLGGYILQIMQTSFVGNLAKTNGGAIYLNNSYTSVLHSEFINNTALQSGGSLYLTWSQTPPVYSSVNITSTNFSFSKAKVSGGALYCISNIAHEIVMDNVMAFLNSVNLRGGFMLLIRCNISLKGHVILNNNTADQGGAIYAQKTSSINFRRGTIFVGHNSAEQDGGAVCADTSTDLTSKCSTIIFSHNTARQNGGALYLRDSTFIINRCQWNLYHLNITFNHNTAVSGGAILIQNIDCENRGIKSGCAIQFLGGWYTHQLYTKDTEEKVIKFSYNKANQGSVIYGGLLNRCDISTKIFPFKVMIDFIKKVSQYEPLPLAISSDPIKICSLNLNSLEPNCRSSVSTSLMRGQAVKIFLALFDQDENLVTGIVRARYRELSAQLGQGEVKRELPGGNYTELAFHVYTENSKATLVLSPEGICINSNLSIVTVNITVEPCVRGFEQNKDRCVCDGRLRLHFIITSCNIDTRELTKKGNVWLSLDKDIIKAHRNCPLGYCQASVNTIRLDSADKQCVNGRTGVLCGGCRENLSIALGSHHCIQCPLYYNFIWLTVIFALAGIGLVALLLTLNMTISSGTINGLVFYANIVSLSGLLSLRSCYLHPILSVFIAWINLDWGIEICFYPGMDTYQKIWLQFAFPVYVWVLVTVIIVASHYSSRAMKLFGSNNIAILATLFLLSYSKLLKTIITALTFTDILTSPADNVTAPMLPHRVWTYDANIDYLQGKHIYLFTVAMLALLLLFLPYTLLLTFGQYARSMPARKKWVSCFTRSAAFISILDAYHAPYIMKHRYWTGLMLLTRCLLFFMFATNIGSDPILTNMYAIGLVILALLTVKLFVKKVYKVAWVGVLELCYLLNLAVLSGTLHYQKGKDSDDGAVCKTITASLSISFVLFGLIIGYHAFLRLSKKRWYILVHSKVRFWWQHRREQVSKTSSAAPCKPHTAPTTTQLELRESLLESAN